MADLETHAGKYVRQKRGEIESLKDIPDRKISQVLNQIDLKLVNDLTSQELAKSRAFRADAHSSRKLRSVSIDRADVRLVKFKENIGAAALEGITGQIIFAPRKFSANIQELLKNNFGAFDFAASKILFPSFVTLAFFHEVAHKASTVVETDGESVIKINSGTDIHSFTVNEEAKPISGEGNDLGELTEAITTRLELEMSEQYIARAPIANVTLDTLREAYKMQLESPQGRNSVVKSLNRFIAVLSEESGIPQEIVWQAFKEAYFSNRNLEEIQSELKEMTGINIVTNMKFRDMLGDEIAEALEELFEKEK